MFGMRSRPMQPARGSKQPKGGGNKSLAPQNAAASGAKLAEVCICGNHFVSDAVFCRKCGVKRPEVADEVGAGVGSLQPEVLDTVPEEEPPPSAQDVATVWHADRRELLEAVEQDGRALRLASGDLQADREVVMAAVRQTSEALQYATDGLRNDPAVVLSALQCHGSSALSFAGRTLLGNRDFMMTLVTECGEALRFASKQLQADRLIVLAAIRSQGSAIQYADSALLDDKDFTLGAAQRSGEVLEHLPPRLQADRDVVVAAVRRSSCALRYASPQLQADRSVALEAVRSHGDALQHCASGLKSDREIVSAALRESSHAFRYASKAIRADREFVLAVVRWRARALRFAAKSLRADREVVSTALQNHGSALEFASEELCSDREFVLAAVRQYGSSTRYISKELLADANFVMRLAACREIYNRNTSGNQSGVGKYPTTCGYDSISTSACSTGSSMSSCAPSCGRRKFTPLSFDADSPRDADRETSPLGIDVTPRAAASYAPEPTSDFSPGFFECCTASRHGRRPPWLTPEPESEASHAASPEMPESPVRLGPHGGILPAAAPGRHPVSPSSGDSSMASAVSPL